MMHVLSDDDMVLIRRLIDDRRNGRNISGIVHPTFSDSESPDVFVARVVGPTAIPARSGAVPGSGECDIFRLRKYSGQVGSLMFVHFTKAVVNNLSTVEIPTTPFLLVHRDKFGDWYSCRPQRPVDNPCIMTLPPGLAADDVDLQVVLSGWNSNLVAAGCTCADAVNQVMNGTHTLIWFQKIGVRDVYGLSAPVTACGGSASMIALTFRIDWTNSTFHTWSHQGGCGTFCVWTGSGNCVQANAAWTGSIGSGGGCAFGTTFTAGSVDSVSPN